MNHEKYIGKSVEGKYTLKWDFRISSQVYSFDNMEESLFKECYPCGLLVANVSVRQLDSFLAKIQRPSLVELWSSIGSEEKILKLLGHIYNNKPVSPPFIAISRHPVGEGKLAILGGIHRYAVAKNLGHSTVPVHLDPASKEEYGRYLSLNFRSYE